MRLEYFLVSRWEVIASFITQHLPESRRSAKETLSQAKQLQKDDMFQKKAANESAFDRAMKTATAKAPAAATAKLDDPSQRYMCKSIHENMQNIRSY